MVKRYCDRCGKELCVEDELKPLVWWTVTRHDSFLSDITVELCNKCYNTDGALVKEKGESDGRHESSDRR